MSTADTRKVVERLKCLSVAQTFDPGKVQFIISLTNQKKALRRLTGVSGDAFKTIGA